MGTLERTLRWCRRYPLAVSVLAAVLIGSVAGLWYLSSLTEFFVRQTALESCAAGNEYARRGLALLQRRDLRH